MPTWSPNFCGCKIKFMQNKDRTVVEAKQCLRHINIPLKDIYQEVRKEGMKTNAFYKNWSNDEINHNAEFINDIMKLKNREIMKLDESIEPLYTQIRINQMKIEEEAFLKELKI